VVGPQTDLLSDGLVDSLIMVEVLMLIEELTGEPVNPDLLEPEAFESGSRLYQTFFTRDAAMEGR
jgi:acyl carrier protein